MTIYAMVDADDNYIGRVVADEPPVGPYSYYPVTDTPALTGTTPTLRLKWNNGAPAWVETATLADQQTTMWERIKGKRDSIKHGGVKVAVDTVDYWFHSDDASRIQQLGLVMMGANVPAVQWKTMSGAFVTMTQTLANAIFNAVASLDQNAFSNAEQHRTAMMASSTPSTYDYSTGWPQVYADTLAP